MVLWLRNNWVPWLPSAAGETRRVFTQPSQCPQRTQLSVTWQTAGSGGAVSLALRLGASSDVKASSTLGMLPTLSPSSGGVGVGSFTKWDPTGGFKKKKNNAASSRTLPERNTKFFGHPGLVQIGFRLCHPLPQQTTAVFPVRRHFLAGQPDRRAGGGAGSARPPGKPRAQSVPRGQSSPPAPWGLQPAPGSRLP